MSKKIIILNLVGRVRASILNFILTFYFNKWFLWVLFSINIFLVFGWISSLIFLNKKKLRVSDKIQSITD